MSSRSRRGFERRRRRNVPVGTFTASKADWRGRRVVKIDPWFVSTQACCECGGINSDMKNLNRRVFRCAACGHTQVRDRTALRDIHGYGEERRNRVGNDPTCGEIADQDVPTRRGRGAGR